jgi:hypothetical protein
MDMNDVDIALHEIQQMVLVSIGAAENLKSEPASTAEPRVFLLSEEDTNMLSFSIFDIQRRVAKLRAGLTGGVA